MRYILKPFAYLLLVVALMIFFLPKVNLYYKAEELLENYKITISAEKVSDSGFSFKIREGVIYFDDLVVAKFDEISFLPLFVYNRVSIKPFAFSDDMKQFVPLKVNNLNITHTVLNPLHVRVEGSGDFGSLTGDIALKDRNVSLSLIPSKVLLKQRPFWLKKMRKDAQGGYHYESAY